VHVWLLRAAAAEERVDRLAEVEHGVRERRGDGRERDAVRDRERRPAPRRQSSPGAKHDRVGPHGRNGGLYAWYAVVFSRCAESRIRCTS
jgi:hypothetical protein